MSKKTILRPKIFYKTLIIINAFRWSAFFMSCILLIIRSLQGIVRKFFVPPSRLPLGFFANLRTTCEQFAKKSKLWVKEDPNKNLKSCLL
jgi:hypothetical protein